MKINGFPRTEEEENICDEIALFLLCPPVPVENFLKRFHHLPYQLDLFRKNQPEMIRLKVIAEEFEVPTKYLIRHIKKQFGGGIKDILDRFSAA